MVGCEQRSPPLSGSRPHSLPSRLHRACGERRIVVGHLIVERGSSPGSPAMLCSTAWSKPPPTISGCAAP